MNTQHREIKNVMPMSPSKKTLSTSVPQLITDNKELAALCKELSEKPFITMDTEFMRENSYYAKLCLVQIGTETDGYLIDPLAPEINLQPLMELMTNPNVTKVFHSSRQDLEIIWNLGKVIPFPLFDTQVAAMVCGFGEAVSYEQLAQELAKAKIDKSSRFSDWARRPLTQAQLFYALSDVTHLVKVYLALKNKLEKNGRTSWVSEEMAILTSPSTYEVKPEDAWKRLSKRVRKPKEIAILKEIAAWREQEAQQRDIPRGRVLKDDALIDIAVSAPLTIEELARLRALPNGFEKSKSGIHILKAVHNALENIEQCEASQIKQHQTKSRKMVAMSELLKVLLKSVSEQEGVASKLIASTEDLDNLIYDETLQNPLLHGWRWQIFGEQALALKNGEVALGIRKSKITVVPMK